MAEEVGYYTLPVILSFDGVDKQVNKSLGGSLGAAGIKGGKAFGKGVADGVKASQSDVKAALDGYSKLYDRQADAAGKLKSELAKLQDLQTKGVSGGRLVAQSERVEKARRDETRAVKDATEAYKDFEQAQKSAANAGGGDVGGGFLDKLKGIGSKAKSAGSEAGAGFVDGVGGPVASLGSKGGAIGLALAAAAALGLGAGALLAKNISAGMDQLQDRANVQAKLGLDEASMKTLADAAAKSYAGNFGDSIAANMDAAGAALQSGLLDPKASQGATTEIINQLDTVSTVLGEDIPNVSRAASQAIRTGLVKDATGAFDLLTKASQNGLNVSDDLLDTVTEYGTQFRKLGLDGPTALGLVQQAVKAGARDTDVAADALKEFSIRAIDGSKTSATAYQAAGLDAQHYTEAIAAGGPAATEAFGEVLTAIRKVTDPAKQSAIAVGLFGTQSEDLGAALQSFDLSTAAQQFGNVDGAAKRASDTMGNTAVGAFESLKRTGEVALDSIQIGLANAFGPQLQEAANWVTGHVPEIIEWLGKIGSTALSVGGDVGQFVAGAIDVLAVLQEVTGRVVGVIANSLAGLFKGAGAVVGLFDDDMGKSITSAGDLLDKYGDVAFHSADTLHGFADMVRSGSTALDGFSTTVADAATQAADARRVTDALGTSVVSIPNGKDIVITDNSPETVDHLKAIGIQVEQTPTGLKLTATTDEAQRILDNYRQSIATGPPINVPARLEISGQITVPNAVTNGPRPVPRSDLPPGRLHGGIFDVWDSVASFANGKLPQQAMIQAPVAGAGLVQWAEPRTGGEAFIPMNGGDRSRKIWAETGRRLGVMSFETGGIRGIDALYAEAQALSGTKYSMASGDDCSGTVSQLVNAMLGLPPKTDRMSTMTAAKWLASKGAYPGLGPTGTFTMGWKNGGPGGGHMAATLPDGTNVEMGGANGGYTLGGNAKGANDPEFTDHAYFPIDALYPDGTASGGAASPFGSGGAGGGGGTPGTGPNGEAGTYSAPDAKDLREANQKVADADTRVREAEAKQRELEADAKDSQKISAQADVDKAKREAADARADLQDVQKGKFTPGKSGGGGKSDMSDIGSIFKSFISETFGLDGSWLPDIGNLMPLKMVDTLLGAFAPADSGSGGGAGGGGGGGGLGGLLGLVPNAQTSSAPFGVPDVMAPPMPPDGVHTGSGGAPGPTVSQYNDLSTTYQGTVGMDPEALRKQNERAQDRGVARINGIPMAAGN